MAVQAIERQQDAGLPQSFVVGHHRCDGLRIGHRSRCGAAYPFGIISIMNRIVVSPLGGVER
jgi:hypothetical protein